MNKAYLRHSEGMFDISFHLSSQEFKVNRRFNFTRRLEEPISNFLSRVNINIAKVINKKAKKKKDDNLVENKEHEVTACLLQNNLLIQDDIPCANVFNINNDNVILRVLDNDYLIVINAPFVDTITLPNSILANFPVYPSKFETVYTEKSLCEFIWYVSKDRKSWVTAGNGFMYTPTNADVNSYLKLSCIPKNTIAEGPLVEVIADCTIDASPGECPFEHRHVFTKEKCNSSAFRVITYNILADLYCDSDFTRTVLYPYCPPYALHVDYRKQLIIKELLGYNGDIICLQEVDRKVYTYDLEPVFSSLNYGSNFMLKGGQVAEGLACFYDNSRFRFIEEASIVIADEIGNNSIFALIWEKICTNEKLKERLLNRTTALQTVTLENTDSGNLILLANTHLYFHPDADHIRLLQGYITIRYLEDIHDKLQEKYKDKNITTIFCGDFNSVPECGIYQLYTTGFVSESIIDFKSNAEEAIEGVNLRQQFQLGSACGTPKFTNFTAGFQDCLDYIYYDKTKLAVEQVIPLPTVEELSQNTALPSVVFPSDHIALVADLKCLQNN
ncbi:hypothetical protein Trydic_g7910 [Trypoxylus dichotomus]